MAEWYVSVTRQLTYTGKSQPLVDDRAEAGASSGLFLTTTLRTVHRRLTVGGRRLTKCAAARLRRLLPLCGLLSGLLGGVRRPTRNRSAVFCW